MTATDGRPLRTVLVDAERRLATAGVPSPRTDAELLLAHVLGVPRTRLVLSDEVDRTHLVRFESLLAKRLSRQPLQHLLGEAPFRHLTLAVGRGVFVPRPETEIVTEAAIRALREAPGRLAVDLCSGSGAIGLSIALEVPGSTVHLVESEAAALPWLERNAAALAAEIDRVGSTVHVHVGDAGLAHVQPLSALVGLVDVVACNPPYIPDAAVPRDPEVREHDPPRALFGGTDGLDVVRTVAGSAAALLHAGGVLVMEHGDAQGESGGDAGVPFVLREAGHYRGVVDRVDLAGRDRYTVAIRS